MKAMREASSMQTWTNSQPTPRRVALTSAVAGDAVADALEAAELLDVDVDQLAGMLALVAAHRLGRLQRREPVETQPPQDAADGRRRHADLGGDLLAGVALPAQSLDGGARGRRCLAWQ